jgi:hypothetical protein
MLKKLANFFLNIKTTTKGFSNMKKLENISFFNILNPWKFFILLSFWTFDISIFFSF